MANLVGVNTTRSTAGPLAFGADPGDNLLIAITAERGPSDTPIAVSSWSRFQQVFGGATPFSAETRYSAGYECLKIFFSKTRATVWVLRIVDSSATTATLDLQDRGGTPEPTLRVKGKGEGAWANDLDIKIEDGTQSNTFKLSVLDSNGDELESWDNLKMLGAHLTRINDQSDWIQVEDLGSTNSAPDDRPATGTFDLGADTSGVDGNEPNASTIVGTTSANGDKTGLKAFRSKNYGRGFIIAPDLDDDSTVVDELEVQSADYHRVYLSSTDDGATVSTAKTQRNDHDAFNSGFYFPRAKVEDELTEEIKTIPPTAHVVADWMNAIERDGPGKAPAGADFNIDFVRGLETRSNGRPQVDGPTGVAEDLLAEGINPIYDRDGTGAKVWGARAATSETAWQYLHAGYLYNLIASRIEGALEQLLYDVADEQFFQQVELGAYSFMVDLHREGAFAGEAPGPADQPDPDAHAFAVKCSEDMLSSADKNNGIVRVSIWFKEALTAETIEVDIAKRTQ
ncbi:MAG: hypothetical protein U5L04_02630 [Trueperaceae bacterium]|nr:hypothetical protein [Trueperaceae bacterium]